MTPTLKAKLREELGSLTSDAKLDRVYRAVLEGIREPTEAVIEASGASYDDPDFHANDFSSGWRHAIDALLSQGEAVE